MLSYTDVGYPDSHHSSPVHRTARRHVPHSEEVSIILPERHRVSNDRLNAELTNQSPCQLLKDVYALRSKVFAEVGLSAGKDISQGDHLDPVSYHVVLRDAVSGRVTGAVRMVPVDLRNPTVTAEFLHRMGEVQLTEAEKDKYLKALDQFIEHLWSQGTFRIIFVGGLVVDNSRQGFGRGLKLALLTGLLSEQMGWEQGYTYASVRSGAAKLLRSAGAKTMGRDIRDGFCLRRKMPFQLLTLDPAAPYQRYADRIGVLKQEFAKARYVYG